MNEKKKMSVLLWLTVAMMIVLVIGCNMDPADSGTPVGTESETPADSGTPVGTESETPADSGTPVGTPPENETPPDSGTPVGTPPENETPPDSSDTPMSSPPLEDTPQSGTLETTLYWGDATFEGIPDVVYLSRSQKNAMPSSIRLTVSGFDSVIWRIDGQQREFSGNASILLAAEDFYLGQHKLLVKGTKGTENNAVPYSKTINLVVVL
jgi:hypothetical protein